MAKRSLEKISAEEADVFTTVSDITSKECTAFLEKPVDIVTPNGFEDKFVPSPEEFGQSRASARKKLLRLLLWYVVKKFLTTVSLLSPLEDTST